MAVKKDGRVRLLGLEQRQPGRELVDKKDGGLQRAEFRRKQRDGEDEVELPGDGAQDGEAAEEGRRDEPVSSDADVEGACVCCLVRW